MVPGCFNWCSVVLGGSGCFRKFTRLFRVVSVCFNAFKPFSLSLVNEVLQTVFGCHGSLCFVVFRFLNCVNLFQLFFMWLR